MSQFAVGQPLSRFEDLRLTTGKGRYVADINHAGQAHGFVLRSPYANAKIDDIDLEDALAMPGVLLILTGADYATSGLGRPAPKLPLTRRDGSPAFIAAQPLLAGDHVRFVGDNVAFVVAETGNQAKAAAEVIAVDYDPLDVIVRPETSLAADGEPVWPDCSNGEVFTYLLGDKAAVDAGFAEAAHIVDHEVAINRVAVNPMEPRGCLGSYDIETGRYSLRYSGQNPHYVRNGLAEDIFHQPADRFQVIAEDVGGGFGVKAETYPEYGLCLWAAEKLNRPVKWIAERSESFLCDSHARELTAKTSLALDEDGHFLALRVRNVTNMGAYFTSDRNSVPPTRNVGGLAGTYTTPAIDVEVTSVFTHTATIGPYRGAGRPEASYILESTIDHAARVLNIDPAELRRRNTIPNDAMPYKSGLVFTYDSGRFAENLELCLDKADYDTFEARRAASFEKGHLRGIGIANTVEQAAGQGLEAADIVFDKQGRLTLMVGTKDHGQGHHTTFAQILSDRLGIDPDEIDFLDGDTDKVFDGSGSYGSRSITLGGTAVIEAAGRLIEKGKIIAAEIFDTDKADISFEDGTFSQTGANRFIDFSELAKSAYQLALDKDDPDYALSARATFEPKIPNFPNGCYICELEIERETGVVSLIRFSVVDDVGTVINPLLLKGQIHGGIAQGVGQALMEDLAIDPETGQVLAGSFMDYCMPRADDFCSFDVATNEVPTPTNPLGVKGAGEAGNVGALAATMNAINNALASIDADTVDMPATPQKLWRAIQQANTNS